ncbi:MAG: FeoA family protein [Oscillospiraceae bacterium]|nr:FeoA family protein [Oscillospiraceae bacterium]
MKLSRIKPGGSAVIKSNNAPGAHGKRLLDMGFVPGAKVTVIRRAPFGDPVVVTLFGYTIGLRMSDADMIETEISEEQRHI